MSSSDLFKKLPIVVVDTILDKLYKIQLKEVNKKIENEISQHQVFKSIENLHNSLFFINLKKEPLFLSKNFLFENFHFILRAEGNFVNYTKYPDEQLDKNFKNVQLNLDKEFLRKIMERYLFSFDLKNSVVAGGFFSKYNLNNVSKNFQIFTKSTRKTRILIFTFAPIIRIDTLESIN